MAAEPAIRDAVAGRWIEWYGAVRYGMVRASLSPTLEMSGATHHGLGGVGRWPLRGLINGYTVRLGVEFAPSRVAPDLGCADACEGDIVLADHGPGSSGLSTGVDPSTAGFAVCCATVGGHRVVHLSGELDVAARDAVRQACLEGVDLVVVVDMAELSFMDCCGYGALIAVRRILTDLGGSLVMCHQVGQPARLLDLLSVLEAG